jgi:hypothetical protein
VVEPGYEQVLQHANAERRKLNFTRTIALEVFLWGNRRKIAVQKKCKCGVLDRKNFGDTTRLK